jgi:hypothetical protein
MVHRNIQEATGPTMDTLGGGKRERERNITAHAAGENATMSRAGVDMENWLCYYDLHVYL